LVLPVILQQGGSLSRESFEEHLYCYCQFLIWTRIQCCWWRWGCAGTELLSILQYRVWTCVSMWQHHGALARLITILTVSIKNFILSFSSFFIRIF